MVKINKLISDYIQANVFIAEKGDECLIIDCGASVEDVKKVVGNRKVAGILLTHGHYDHSRYCIEYSKAFNCPVTANNNVVKTMTDIQAIYSDKGQTIEDFSNFKFIEGDITLKLGSFDIKCYYCPGHSVCCECYLIDGNLFAGDVLFYKAMGRTDLKFSNKYEMHDSLEKLKNLDFDMVYSGHGVESSKKDQQLSIPILQRFLYR